MVPLIPVVAAFLLLLIPVSYVLLLTLLMIVFILPGLLPVARAVHAVSPAQVPFSILLLTPVSFALSTLFCLLFRLLGIQSIWLILLVPLIQFFLAKSLVKRGMPIRFPRFHPRADTVAILVLLSITLAILVPSFRNVGRTLPEGRAYRAYFTADFVWGMAVVAELAKEGRIPRNMFLLNEPLHYYWPHYLFSSLEHGQLPMIRTDQLLLINDLLVTLLFALFFYTFMRTFIQKSASALLGCLSPILFASAEGLFLIFFFWGKHLELGRFTHFNVDAVSHWILGSLPIDGMHRLLLYQPQHQFGLALSLLALRVIIHVGKNPSLKGLVGASTLFSLAMLFSPFIPLILGVIGLLYLLLFGLRSKRSWFIALSGLPLVLLPGLLVLLLNKICRVTMSHTTLLKVGPNPLAFCHPLTGLLISLGPLLLLALPGGWQLVRERKSSQTGLFVIWIIVCTGFYFYTDVPDHQHVYAGWRASQVAMVALGILAAKGFQAMEGPQRKQGKALRWGAALVMLVSLPTLVMDLYNTQDISNRHRNRARHLWTTIISPAEVEALRWIRFNTSDDAVVQVDPVVRGNDSWAYIPAFAERRMAVGLPISMIPLKPYEVASEGFSKLLKESEPDRIFKFCRLQRINYLFLGIEEQKAYPSLIKRLLEAPRQFILVQSNSRVTIFKVHQNRFKK